MSTLRLTNQIDGRPQAPAYDLWLDVHEPATGSIFAHCPDSHAADVEEAVQAAQAAAPGWAHTPAEQRAATLCRLADLIEARLETFAALESRDSGKPIALARAVDIPRAISNLRYFAAAIITVGSESHAMETGQPRAGAINYTLRQPLGVVGCISPWNLPLYLFTWKIAPALAAGNTVVAKPSEVTPCTAALLGELSIDAGFPAGVLNIVHGRGNVGQAIVEHPTVKAISFTGRTATGARIASLAAASFKKVSLELGGKNPAILFADADLSDAAMDTIVRSGFSNQGEICLRGSRLLVQRAIYDAFRQRYLARVKALRVGDPNHADTNLGALVSRAHYGKVLGCIEQARADGGQMACGGEAVTNQQEIFGPVVSLIPFEDEADALAIANNSRYVLAASVWTQNLSRAHRLSAQLDFGIVWVNCWMVRDLRTPFGGTKQSGMGREGGIEALQFFTEPKNVCIAYGPPSANT